MLSLATATRDYARFVENMTFDRLPLSILARISEPMGPEIWAWQYALRLTRGSPWRARPLIDERVERALATRSMIEGIETWTRAMAVLDERVEQARVYGWPMPQPLAVPDEIRAALQARDAAALERIRRRRGRTGEGETGTAAVPDDAVHRPPFPGRPA
ncbi:hypothetical protein ASF58_19040 [Methylobacterium sp. Leaf125]|uniref:hypothetical protein n=1 Tax=Methylobacterium sp. Leaf125 TaxID=1736265 RepID=UPI0006F4388C|nr:hypothetical protein [Methylobacterium sp. Leaf125]KQQ45672.1 hypothetical protein ASF58_19040 [Methylobacterium sp. Leaf125]